LGQVLKSHLPSHLILANPHN